MITLRQSEILAILTDLDPWLTKLGITPSRTRIHRAIEVVREAEEGRKKFRETGQPTKIGNVNDFYFGMVEALEFFDIFRAFEHERPEVLAPKLDRILSGPFRPAEETEKNSAPRNTMFELALAADLRLRGADVAIGEPDISLNIDGQRFLAECKRPFREDSIRANVRGAAAQLARHLEDEIRAAGIIAVSVSRISNPGTKLFLAPSEEAKERLGDQLETMMREEEESWTKYDLHPRVTAVLFHVRTPGVVRDRDQLTMMSYAAVMSTGKAKEAFEVLRERLKPLLSY